ncbi:hypothetical protein FOZ76_18595 [Verticiella sediminum]|uniref:Uncharacterized protein n=1 Tax=Verticiella sediminum TaxID=1247510 RepID=A0A556AES4_9BURK|nr:hypothetical protein [Verticiella sediminum]TSH91382.1 hypothetical protein FOZ76_18595 [Verticiella sediminum]
MRTINTLTVMYDENEDRLHLALRCSDGHEQGLWLTQRLANLLLKVLTGRVAEKAAESERAHRRQGAPAQSRAAAGPAAASEPAQSMGAGGATHEAVPVEVLRSSPHGLVHTVNVVRHDNGLIHLVFRWDAEGAAALPLDSAALARVLDIFRLRYRSAGWSTEGVWVEGKGIPSLDAGMPPNATLH